MLIGIVSERTDEKTCFATFVKETIFDEHNPFGIVAIRLSHTAEKLEKFTSKRRTAIIRKAIRRLEKADVHHIVFSESLRKYKHELMCEDVFVANGENIFYKFVPDAVRKAAHRCSVNLLASKVCITAAGQDRITEYLMREMCYDIKNLTVFTDDTERTQRMCESFAEDTGLFPQTSDIKNSASKNADVLIDLDRHRVRVGRNVVIDGVEFDFKLNGYSVNMLDIAACLGDVDLSDRVISYKCGKNKLTLWPV